jgi:hypothetical protein
MKSRRKRVLLAATSVWAALLGTAGGELADGAMHAANAARKHLAGVKYEDVSTAKPAKSTAPQKSMGTRNR